MANDRPACGKMLNDDYESMPFMHEVAGNRFTFYPCRESRLSALLALIEGAERNLRLFFYMFRADSTGRRVVAALEEAVARGVDVELIIDSFGSGRETRLFTNFVAAGGKFAHFMARFGTRYLIRNHQKMIIADEQSAMIGGFNITDQYFVTGQSNGWHDLGVLLEGRAVSQLVRWFCGLANWAYHSDENFRAIRALVREWQPDEGPVRLVIGGPTRTPSNWAMQVKRDIAAARRLDMVMAYFSPPRSYRRLIARVGRRGFARLILPGKSDNTTTIAASRALYRKFLKSKVDIQEYQAEKLHTKLLVTDHVTYVGSANFDMRSIRLNLELMLRIDDPDLAVKMRSYIDGLTLHSLKITRASHQRKATLWNRMRWWAGWMLVGVVDYTVTRRLNFRS